MQSWKMRTQTALSAFVLLWLIVFPSLVLGQEGELVPETYRVKIDAVDVSEAPNIRIRATFLDKRTIPVSPLKISQIEVFADGELLNVVPKVSTFKDGDIPLDLALIVPISERFSEKELDEMKKSLIHIIEQTRKGDRVAGYFDDGRAINVAPLGKADDVIDLLKRTTPKAQSSFLYSSLDKAIEEMNDPAKMRSPARRAIILVTDAFDTYTYRAADVQREILQAYQLARQNDIRIYVVMYRPFIRNLIPSFEGLSRKTGATYRYAGFADQIAKSIDYAWGEIYGQLVIDFKHPGLRASEAVVYRIDVMREGGIVAKSDDYREIVVGDLKFNWRLFGIVTGIIVGILLIVGIVLLIVYKRRQKRKEEAATLEEQILEEKIERGEACPKCRRTMMKDWTECMFCAREAAEEINKQKAENREKALADAEKKGVKLEGKICGKCNRTMMPQWKECLFCKAGIGEDDRSQKRRGVAPMRGDKKPKTSGNVCPSCKREMKAHWTICLYCEADAEAAAAAKVSDKKPEALGPLCSLCGRPQKAHWDICLYCEADRRLD